MFISLIFFKVIPIMHNKCQQNTVLMVFKFEENGKTAGYGKQGTDNELLEKPSITNLSPNGQTP